MEHMKDDFCGGLLIGIAIMGVVWGIREFIQAVRSGDDIGRWLSGFAVIVNVVTLVLWLLRLKVQ